MASFAKSVLFQSLRMDSFNKLSRYHFRPNIFKSRNPYYFSTQQQCARSYATRTVYTSEMKRRRAARILVIDPGNRVLLFEYSHASNNDPQDALANKGSYFTTPGGKALDSESYEECAARELREETGISENIRPRIVAVRQAPLMVSSGTVVLADERYFAVFVNKDQVLDRSLWTQSEKQNIKRSFWCTSDELKNFEGRNLWPSRLREILASAIDPKNDREPPLMYKSEREQIGDTVINVIYDEK